MTNVELLRDYVAEPNDDNGWTNPKLQSYIDSNPDDLYAAAAAVWRAKAAARAEWYRVTIDGATFERDRIWQNAMRMVSTFENLASGEVKSIRMEVSADDTDESEIA